MYWTGCLNSDESLVDVIMSWAAVFPCSFVWEVCENQVETGPRRWLEIQQVGKLIADNMDREVRHTQHK